MKFKKTAVNAIRKFNVQLFMNSFVLVKQENKNKNQRGLFKRGLTLERS
jgi:hypothetical protein